MKLTHTKDEHRAAIAKLAEHYIASGMSPETAITTAGEKWRECIKVNAESKADEVLRWLKRTS
jgi:hypothetical protein